MSLNKKSKLLQISKATCINLRKNQTDAEKLFWEKVRNKNFLSRKFYRQYPFFYDQNGQESFFVVDFYCHSEKLIIELDGKYHQYKLKEDQERTEILNHLKLRIVRFTNNEVINNINEVLLRVENIFLKKE